MKLKTLSVLVLFLVMAPLSTMTYAGEEEKGNLARLPSTTGPETTLNLASHYLNSVFMNTLATLELISSTPEAGAGDWEGIKGYLAQLKSRLPGTYFYVLPDGNYYTLKKGHTGLNLNDRGYFESLMAGDPVRGFTFYGRSSDKKSALVAAPVKVDYKVTGALGASIHLDDLQAKLNRTFALPGHYTWFVLDSKGNTVLDRDPEFIFMNALTQGSPSMQKAVAKALKKEKGEVKYEHGGIMRHANYQKMPEMDWWMFLAEIQVTETPKAGRQ